MEYPDIQHALRAVTDLAPEIIGASWFPIGITAQAGAWLQTLLGGWAIDPAMSDAGAGPLLDRAAPYLFAAASGALAVAIALAAAALWRKLDARTRELGIARSRLSSDLSTEKVFVVEPGRLRPASPATEAFIRLNADGGRRSGGGRAALLREVFGGETAEALAPLLRRLAEAGETFERVAPDAQGGLWRFTGETIGARAVVRLQPARGLEDTRSAAIPEKDEEGVASPAVDSGPRKQALEGAPAGVVLFDAEARMSFANAAARRLFRMQEEWIALRPSFRALIDHLREGGRMPERHDHEQWRASALADPIAAFAEPRLWRLSGGESLRVSSTSIGAPEQGGFALFVTDETSARESDRRYKIAMGARRATIAAIDEGLAVIGGEGRLQLANPAFVEMWGLDDGLLDEQRAGQFTLTDIASAAGRSPQDRAIWAEITAAVSIEVRRARRGLEFTAQASRDRTFTTRITPLPDGATLIGVADVTDAQRVERALREKAEALEAADKLKTEFLNDIAYQLKTPLNAVIGFSEMLRQGMLGPLDRRQQEYLGYILTAANDLHEMIADSLSLGALTADASGGERSVQDLGALGRSVTAMLAKRAERRGVSLDFADDDGDGAPRLPVLGDETRLKQAIFSASTAALSCAGAGDKVEIRTILAAAAEIDGAAAAVEGPVARFEARLERRHPLGAEPDGAAHGGALSLARRIVRVDGGRGAFEETVDGALAVLEFPLAALADEGLRTASGGDAA